MAVNDTLGKVTDAVPVTVSSPNAKVNPIPVTETVLSPLPHAPLLQAKLDAIESPTFNPRFHPSLICNSVDTVAETPVGATLISNI